MVKNKMKILLWLFLVILSVTPGYGAEKIRLIVDKVFSRNAEMELYEADFQALKAAGFNVVSNRWHGESFEHVRRYAETCAKLNLRYLPWLRGTVECSNKDEQLIYENGVRLTIAAPLSDTLWNYLDKYFTGYAEMSVEFPGLIGVFLDFEVYSKHKYANAYPLSYDNDSWRKFFAAQKKAVPDIAPVQRYDYLVKQQLQDAYYHWMSAEFRSRSQALRAKIDRINPAFRLVVYNGDALITNEFIPVMNTKTAPAVLATSNTYGPPCPILDEAENIMMVADLLKMAAKTAMNGIEVLGGIDPIERGCIPEFAGKLAVKSAEITNGYWIFYEGFPKDSIQNRDYIRHFSLANQAIKSGNYRYADSPFADTALQIEKWEKSPSKKTIGVFGGKKYLYDTLKTSGAEVREISVLNEDELKKYDLLLLQNLNVPAEPGSRLQTILETYVKNGGSVFLTHDSGFFMHGIFKSVAEREFPKFKVSNLRHVLDLEMKTLRTIGKLPPGSSYRSSFGDHAVFKPGKSGEVYVVNRFDEPVIIAGAFGKGKVGFAGNYFAYQSELKESENEVFQNIIKYLLTKDN